MSEGRRTRAQTTKAGMGSGKRSSGGNRTGAAAAAAAMAAGDDASSTAAVFAFPAADEAEGPKRRRVAPAAAWRRVMVKSKGNSSGGNEQPAAVAAPATGVAAAAEHSAAASLAAAAPTAFQYCRSKPPPAALLTLEASARGIATQLGLDQFLAMAAVPALNEQYCNAFISTYVKEMHCGIVRNQTVPLIGETVASIVQLPIGGPLVLEAGELHDDTDSLVPVFRALIERMGCTRDGDGEGARKEVAAALEAMGSSGQTPIQWSSHLADRMHLAILLTREENAVLGCGRWLSGLIQKALGEPVTWELLDALEQPDVDPRSGAQLEMSTTSTANDDDSDDDPVIQSGRMFLAAMEAAEAKQKNADDHSTQQMQERTDEDEAPGDRDTTCEEKCMITGEATMRNDWSLKLSEFKSRVQQKLMEVVEEDFAKMSEEILLLNAQLLNAKAKENDKEARMKGLRLEAEKQQEELQKEKVEHDEIAGKLRQEAEDSRQKLHAMNEEMEKLRALKKIWTEERVSKDLTIERLENDLASAKAMQKAREEDLLQAKTQLMEVSEKLSVAQDTETVCKNEIEKMKAEHKEELLKVKGELEKQTSLRELWESSVDNHRHTFKETYEAYVDLKHRHKELHKELRSQRGKYAPATPMK